MPPRSPPQVSIWMARGLKLDLIAEGVENRTHYVRDTRFHEDASRIRRNPCIFALLRSFALNLMRFNGIKTSSLGLYDNALSLDRVLAYEGL